MAAERPASLQRASSLPPCTKPERARQKDEGRPRCQVHRAESVALPRRGAVLSQPLARRDSLTLGRGAYSQVRSSRMELRFGVNPLKSVVGKESSGSALREKEGLSKGPGRFSLRLPRVAPGALVPRVAPGALVPRVAPGAPVPRVAPGAPGSRVAPEAPVSRVAPGAPVPPWRVAPVPPGPAPPPPEPSRPPAPPAARDPVRLSALTRSLNSLQALHIPAYFRRLPGPREQGTREQGTRERMVVGINLGERGAEDGERRGSEERGLAASEETQLFITEDSDESVELRITDGPKLNGSILKLPGRVKTRTMIKHVEFLDNLIDQDSCAREF